MLNYSNSKPLEWPGRCLRVSVRILGVLSLGLEPTQRLTNKAVAKSKVAPRAGLEPATSRLTADCSTS